MTVVDAFAGPGGWDVAAAELGSRPIGIEHDASACATRAAAGHLTIRQDVTTLDPARFRPLEGLIGSPPCPTFSAAGGRAGIAELRYLIEHVHACVTGWKPYAPPEALEGLPTDGGGRETILPDPRSALVLEPLRFALECVPTWIALEQVPDVLPVWEAYQYVLRANGWSVWCGILEAERYGVPQTRDRAILMAHRRKDVQPPAPTHQRFVNGQSAQHEVTMFGEILPWISMAEALGWGFDDRPCMTVSAGGTSTGGAEPLGRHCREQLLLHTNRGQDADGNRQTRPTDQPAPALTGKSGAQWAFHRPATTICGDPRVSWPGHHDEDARSLSSEHGAIRLSVSDALILQSFHPDYPVQGTQTKRHEQVGNAIPPRLARAVLSQLLEQLEVRP